jgi:hypothetical protein
MAVSFTHLASGNGPKARSWLARVLLSMHSHTDNQRVTDAIGAPAVLRPRAVLPAGDVERSGHAGQPGFR